MEQIFKDRKTKIICTIGPSSDSEETIKKMHEKGMNIARLNFSHGNHEYHQRIFELIQDINTNAKIPIATILDTKGPEIRTGKFREPVILKENDTVTITTSDSEYSTKERISITYKDLHKKLSKGALIYIADGTIELVVSEINEEEIICNVNVGGEVNTRKNVNIPSVKVELPAISEEDVKDIELGIRQGVDFIAQSFVKTADDVKDLRNMLKRNNADNIHIIAKIESSQAIENIDEIIAAADAIMIARGDLGVQIPIENIPSIQKSIIKKCNILGKPVITATQMLESMTKNPRPTRAEATDIANAILDGTDAIMLSGETASGMYPIRALEMMDRIARKTEQTLKHLREGAITNHKDREYKITITDSISKAVCDTAKNLGATAIITCTSTGRTARQISRHRPLTPIYAATPNPREYAKLILAWGVIPILIQHPKDTDMLMANAIDALKDYSYIQPFDLVVITAGIPFNISGEVNLIKVELIR